MPQFTILKFFPVLTARSTLQVGKDAKFLIPQIDPPTFEVTAPDIDVKFLSYQTPIDFFIER